jgi:hypothetical protein
MAISQWHRFYGSRVAAPPAVVFALLSDLPSYARSLGSILPAHWTSTKVIHVGQLKATVDVHIHYSVEPEDDGTHVTRWLALDVTMPILFRPLRRLLIRSFDEENVRTMAVLKEYAEAQPDGSRGLQLAS